MKPRTNKATAASPLAEDLTPLVLENSRLGLSFGRATGALEAIHNKLTGEIYEVRGDTFTIEAVGFQLDEAGAELASFERHADCVHARYRSGGTTVDVSWTLGPDLHFAEKRLVLAFGRPCGLKTVVLGRPAFSADGLRILCYRFPKFGRNPGEEPTRTFFGRTPRGGFFAGVEVPFDASSLERQQVTLAYAPSLKVRPGDQFTCEPAYFGVYRRNPGDGEMKGPAYRRSSHLASTVDEPEELPLRSESDAMSGMVSVILGPPRFGLVPMVCSWHSEMEHRTYTETSLEADMRSLDFMAECGIDWVSDSHPWGGETEKMNALGEADPYVLGPLVRRFLEHARKVGVKVTMWPTMNMTHPWEKWALKKAGVEERNLSAPLRADKPEWRMKPSAVHECFGNCIANRPFLEWLIRVNLEGMATGLYGAWCMDGSFFGDDGTTVRPADCQSDLHDHLPGDSNDACQRALADLAAAVRRHHPGTYVFMCRPPMDLGIWALRNVAVCFTLLESGTGGSNVAGGDSIRAWSRVRLHRDFQPHYLDQPLLFPSHQEGQKDWSSDHLDYILLSALSSSPNQLFYLPTRTGIPAEDKAEIRRWLDWGRKNIEYLKVRRDLPDWPAAGRVDGNAHLVGDRGLVFLFNPAPVPHEGGFALTRESIGLEPGGTFRINQEYPASDRNLTLGHGGSVRWPIPGHGVVILRIEPAV